MADDPRFGPAAQTSAQRTRVLQQMQRTFPLRYGRAAQHQAVFARYVSGEVSWEQVQQLTLAAHLPTHVTPAA